MNNMFSKAAIWVVIALVLFTVFKQFDNRGMAAGATPIAYSDFIDEIKAERIKDATIEDRSIIATTQDGKKIKTAATLSRPRPGRRPARQRREVRRQAT